MMWKFLDYISSLTYCLQVGNSRACISCFCFMVAEWEAKDEDHTDVNVWEDNWDDDTVEDDFSVQLR